MSVLRVGMIGLDTSHCEAFTKVLNDAGYPHHVPGAEVAGAYPGGSRLTAFSRDRVAEITSRMRDERGVKIHDSIEAAAEGMDAFLLESVDGRQHLEQFEVLAEYGKPVFIDKPLTCSYEQARRLADLAVERGIPVMTASAIRFAGGIADVNVAGAAVHACEAFGPMKLPDDYPPYFWYGIHSADVLFSLMGRGCRAVRAIHREETDLIVGEWEDGRIGSVRGTRFDGGVFGCTVFGAGGVRTAVALDDPPYYVRLVREIVRFFRTGESPVDLEESVEIIGFLDAATRSRERDGAAVEL